MSAPRSAVPPSPRTASAFASGPSPAAYGDGAAGAPPIGASAAARPGTPEGVDAALLGRLKEEGRRDPDLWTAPDRDRRADANALFSYPAMMVPKVQRALIEAVQSVQPDVQSLYDPFVGAGSSLVAAMPLGLDCTGRDINPLAILVSRVKTGPWQCDAFKRHAESVVADARGDRSTAVLTDFENHVKWFEPGVAVELSRLRRAIRAVKMAPARRFLWVTLAETIRLTSNDRTSTFKLHARPDDEIQRRSPAPIDKFEELARRHVGDLGEFKSHLARVGHLSRGRYKSAVALALHDAKVRGVRACEEHEQFDLIVTSPPYGDNHTTVPYGQHSFLPLHWIDLEDIHPEVDPSCLRTTREIDSRSLGGQRLKDQSATVEALSARSPALGGTLARLSSFPPDRIARVASFYADFELALDHIVSSLRPDAYLIFTLGNRSVGRGEIPNDRIVSELLVGLGVVEVVQLKRQIVGKRMATRNRLTATMKEEDILVFRNTAAALRTVEARRAEGA